MRDARYITTQSELEAAVFRMHGAARLALDTEFMRERSYFAQLCLIQIATDSDCVLVDPLGGLELAPLFELLAERSRLKVLHAARQDLEVLFQAGGTVPGPVFDTQVAAALLGFPPQVGYADLVARQLGHSIDKGQTRTDWSRRPRALFYGEAGQWLTTSGVARPWSSKNPCCSVARRPPISPTPLGCVALRAANGIHGRGTPWSLPGWLC